MGRVNASLQPEKLAMHEQVAGENQLFIWQASGKVSLEQYGIVHPE